jgi:hypothetical protein
MYLLSIFNPKQFINQQALIFSHPNFKFSFLEPFLLLSKALGHHLRYLSAKSLLFLIKSFSNHHYHHHIS